jgi:hypothetical protein
MEEAAEVPEEAEVRSNFGSIERRGREITGRRPGVFS